MAHKFPILVFAVVEFDIDKGNTIGVSYPSEFDWEQFECGHVADLCLPDGAHIHTCDHTYLFLHPKRVLTNGKPNEATPSTAAAGMTYGISLFKKRVDKTVKRGAVQRAALILSSIPAFDSLEPIARALVDLVLESPDKATLKKAFESLRKSWEHPAASRHISFLDQSIPASTTWIASQTHQSNTSTSLSMIIPPQEDAHEGASLSELVQRFGVDTMFLWYTLLLEQRILFCGQPAHLVGRCCLACPLLVAPLSGFSSYVYPYVALTDLTPLHQPSYIAGTTNQLLETKTEWYDMMASFSTGIVRKSNAKISSLDKEFILNVMSGMHAGEKWVRDQFRSYTLNFLESVRTGAYMCSQHAALGDPFKLSPLYERYSASVAMTDLLDSSSSPRATGSSTNVVDATRKPGSRSAADVLADLKLTQQESGSLSDSKKKQLLWELLQQLVDLSVINKVCELDGAAIVAPLLNASSAQVRKYAVAVLAQLAISIKGQVSLVRNNLIPRVVVMLRDPMPNVASAAAYCIFKISTLFIGVCALVENRVPKMLLTLVCSEEDNLALKMSAVETLIQIHTLDPLAEVTGRDSVKHVLKQSSDAQFRALLAQLLDLWGEERVYVKISDGMQVTLGSLSAPSVDVRTSATSMLLSDISQDSHLTLQLVAAGGVQHVVANALQGNRGEPLARLSVAILCVIADCSMGRQAILGNKVVEAMMAELDKDESPLYVYYVLRFCEVCCQHRETTKRFLALDGISKLLLVIRKYSSRSALRTLLLPPLGAFKALLLLNPPLRVNLSEKWVELPGLYQLIAESVGRGGSSASSQAAQMAEEVLNLLRNLVQLTDPKQSQKLAHVPSVSDLDTDTDERSSKGRRSRSSRKLSAQFSSLPATSEESTIESPPSTSALDSLDDEIDSILAGSVAPATRARSATIAMNRSDAQAAAAALNINVDDIDRLADALMSDSAPAPVKNELDDLVDSLLTDIAPAKIQALPAVTETEEDDIDTIAEKLLKEDPATAKAEMKRKRRSAPIGSIKQVVHSPKWDDLDSLTDDLIKDAKSVEPGPASTEKTESGPLDALDELADAISAL
eukprot:TRINITY_DN5024_c0_g3_i1.p1 TRINITY_DN5024_c0_g3~~TRINITY_DN5024_c0_g3_i1.p1  ORF type:complete len:1078 (+),score=213.78 TRINITY_DN5024_c0_g3_i1:245-3478(+)